MIKGEIEAFADMLKNSGSVVFLGGAGVSTESGIPDFRSEKGIYNAEKIYGFRPEEILSYPFFLKNTSLFYKYYFENFVFEGIEPNKAHYALARLEENGKLAAVLTQNVDGLHQKAGSKNVLELHGSAHRYSCMKCERAYSYENVFAQSRQSDEGVPRCQTCGGLVRPDIVLYSEGLNSGVLESAIRHIQNADLMIVGGTSLTVYPVAGLTNYFNSDNIVLINKDKTPFDQKAKLVINEAIGEVLFNVVNKI